MATRSRVSCAWLFALGIGSALCQPVSAEEVLRLTVDSPGNSKAVSLSADEVTLWSDPSNRVMLLSGKVLVEHGVVQLRAQKAVAWIDSTRYAKTGIIRVDLFSEGAVTLENGPTLKTAPTSFVTVYTRGEVKLRSAARKILQEPQTGDPFVQKADRFRLGELNPGDAKTTDDNPKPSQSVPFVRPTPEARKSYYHPPQEPPPTLPPGGNAPPTGVGIHNQNSNNTPSPTAQPLPGTRPSMVTVPPPGAIVNGGGSPVSGGVRNFSIVPRTSAGYDPQYITLENGEHALICSGGIILVVRTADNKGLIDVEADRLVIWTRESPRQLLSRMRSQQGQNSQQFEIYLSGNVELRYQQEGRQHKLAADEVYYDVGRNVAVARKATLELRQPGLPEPIQVRSQELLQLSPTQFKAIDADISASRLPSDPGLKIHVAESLIETKNAPKKTIFGKQVVDRNGNPETEEQRLFRSKEVILKIEDTPVFYLPFVQGDANDPLGPLEAVGFNYNRIFGFQFTSSWNVYDLIGIEPRPGTRWRFDADYFTARGPALGTQYDAASKTFFGIPSVRTDRVRAFGIYDDGTDILGGGRGEFDDHPQWRGRFTSTHNVQDLPHGFTFQAQVSALSDKNFLEQYFKNEFDNGYNQETFLYLKQQQDSWAWTLLAEPRIRNWVTETESLPRADGYWLGQSFFNLFTYNVHGSAGYFSLQPTDVPPPAYLSTDQRINTGRFDLWQELSLPFTVGPLRLAPYGVIDLTYYNEDLTGNDRGRFIGGGGVRAGMPLSRLYSDVQSDLFNLNGLNHKIVFGANYYIAHSNTPYNQLPQLDRLNDDATDQALRDITPLQPIYNPKYGVALATSPLYNPQLYAIRRLLDTRIDTMDSIQVLQGDIRQRWQTKRGYPGQQHIVDWMTLDLSASFFPDAARDNFNESFAFLEYDWVWNVGDRTALVSNGWVDPVDDGARVFSFGMLLNRPDRTNFYLGYRQIDPLESRAVTGALTYVFSPKYAMTFSGTYDFGIESQANSLILTRMGSDLQVSLGVNYNSLLKNFGFTFEIVPNIVPPSRRVPGSRSVAGPFAN